MQDPSKLEYFGDRKYAPVHDPSLLDYERVECVHGHITCMQLAQSHWYDSAPEPCWLPIVGH